MLLIAHPPGSMISVYMHPLFAELVVYPRTVQALEALGFLRPKWSSGYVISKPPQSPPLFWHQDWWGWNDPCSYTALPQQLFLMYYLVDTTPSNGCLRVIKGSHLNRHPLHDILPSAHGESLQRVDDANHPAYQHFPGEVDIPVKAGDLVIGDSRLLHASHGNQSDERRDCNYTLVSSIFCTVTCRNAGTYRETPTESCLVGCGLGANCRTRTRL